MIECGDVVAFCPYLGEKQVVLAAIDMLLLTLLQWHIRYSEVPWTQSTEQSRHCQGMLS